MQLHARAQGACSSSSSAPQRLRSGSAAAAAAAAARSSGRRQRGACVVPHAVQGSDNDFGASVARIAKKIQGGLPIIGLLSRLASPEGGFDEIAYPEFCRTIYEKADAKYFDAVKALEAAHGKPAAHRALLMVLWMAKYGPGLVPAKDMVASARRVRVSHDIEVEVDRFEGVRETTRKKYPILERPPARAGEELEVAVDGLAALALGLRDGKEIPPADADRIAALVGFVFPEAGADAVRAAIEARPKRSY
ncbi:calcium homeostasis regulater C [Raphidocelis subcapitata]|uniref:Calcium homeostasis regulater C n=1 Tax=Raphidocelis subcapitata TaxID=307507 RepID=A0A2V0PQY6_9CHLO|nr:calcium homeostasis regulater C [Raphidocelis subcapitata]|eukprot:GBF99937.1 calcium homeostasis regulater C [Raphidocelis subcapitata]